MKADTFAKLVVLDALIEAEVGHFLRDRPSSMELYLEGMVARVSELVDEIDMLDSGAAGRAYDALVDFLAELPEEKDGIVTAAVDFHRAVERITSRGVDRRDLADAATWAIVLDEVLIEIAKEYRLADAAGGGTRAREFARVDALLIRARQASTRMLWNAEETNPEIPAALERLVYEIRYRRAPLAVVESILRSVRRRVARYRPSTITRVGTFILRQLIRREPEPQRPENGIRRSSGRWSGRKR